MRTKVQYVAPFDSVESIYYVRDQYGSVWHSIGKNKEAAVKNAKGKEEILSYRIYNPHKYKKFHNYDFKNLILDMLEQMELQDTYEYELVLKWKNYEVFEFMKKSSLMPCDLLLEINKYQIGKWML
ncbi:hypothetical protein IFU39_16945 [Paenibacillus sp. CFBP 13594]|uniref:hypothetical protein n=1 Tax=Paenibacillus sp. CFBP 13594 TaxID=2774037 RepID=UPI001782E1D6|nr:hypothetical protein [Paenibacillus sp. CFBP 13594]MBD8839501.1 hypothetical protein [Paenibacillus sp. CFBP 13594]